MEGYTLENIYLFSSLSKDWHRRDEVWITDHCTGIFVPFYQIQFKLLLYLQLHKTAIVPSIHANLSNSYFGCNFIQSFQYFDSLIKNCSKGNKLKLFFIQM